MSAASARVLGVRATGAVIAAYVRRVLSPARLLKIGFSIVGVAFAAQLFARAWPPGFDTYCYWSVNPASPYTHAWTELGAFSYSPPMVLLFGLAQNLPFGVFLVLWMGFSIAVLMWLSRGWGLAALLIPPVLAEVFAGNVHLLGAAAIVLGFRYPATWSLLLLTKVTPGIGLLWFAVRREWRSLGIALGTTAAICAVTLAIAPDLWRQWFGFLARTEGTQPSWPSAIPVPLAPRLAAAAVIVVWGARTDRRWTVALSATLALPALWMSGLAMLVAMPRLSSLNRSSATYKLRNALATGLDFPGHPVDRREAVGAD